MNRRMAVRGILQDFVAHPCCGRHYQTLPTTLKEVAQFMVVFLACIGGRIKKEPLARQSDCLRPALAELLPFRPCIGLRRAWRVRVG